MFSFFSTNPAVALLKEDHDQVKSLFDQFEKAKGRAAKTKIVRVPDWAQPPIRYQLAVVKASERQAAAKRFVARVLSKAGRRTLAKAGFGLPRAPR